MFPTIPTSQSYDYHVFTRPDGYYEICPVFKYGPNGESFVGQAVLVSKTLDGLLTQVQSMLRAISLYDADSDAQEAR